MKPFQTERSNRRNQSFVFKSGQKMALRAPYVVICLCTGLVDIYEVKRSQRHLLAAIENNRLVSPILSIHTCVCVCGCKG